MRYANTFQAETPIGAAIASLGTALLNRPSPYVLEQQQAEADYRRAETARALGEVQQQQAQAAAAANIPSLLQKYMLGPTGESPRPTPGFVGPMQPQSRDAYLQSGFPEIAGQLAAAGKYSDLPSMWRAIVANSGASDNAVVRAQAGAGGTLGVNDAVSIPGQQAIADRNFGYDTSLEGQRQTGANTRQGMADATSRSNNAADIASREGIAARSESGVKGGMIAGLIPTLTEAQKLTMAGAQSPYSRELVTGQDGKTYSIDKNDPYGIAGPLPVRTAAPDGGVSLAPLDLSGTVGATQPDALTTANKTIEQRAAQLGVSPQELAFVAQYEDMMKSGGLLGQVSPPPASKARYDAIQQKIAAHLATAGQPAAQPAQPALPPGLTAIP